MSTPFSIDLVAALVASVAALFWVWKIRGMAIDARDAVTAIRAERERDKLAYDVRLQKAESAAASMERLADAVKYGSDLTAAQIANLAEKVAEHATFAKEQFQEIRSEQKAVQKALARKNADRSPE